MITVNSQEVRLLESNGILVKIYESEVNKALFLRNSGIHASGILYINIKLTDDCNMACYYCYETRENLNKNTSVTPDGDIMKCFALKETFQGNIMDKITTRPSMSSRIRKVIDTCNDCIYLPICFGGCEYQNSQSEAPCPIEIFKSTLPKLLEAKVIEYLQGKV